MFKRIHLLFFTVFLGASLAGAQKETSFPSSVENPSHNFYKSLGELTWKLGNKRAIGLLDFIIPLYSERHREMLFLDVRFVRDNKSSREYNVGLAYRHVLPPSRWSDDPFVMGLYGFYDYRLSPQGNVFRQATFGVEALHPWIEGRANIYFPTRHQYELQGTGASPNSFSGFYYYTASSNSKEGAMGGMDAEIGARVPLPWGHDYQLRFFGGGYKFQRRDYKSIAGPRFRTEFSIYNPLEPLLDMPAARFKLGAEYAYDHVRGNIGFFDIGIRIPLGSFADKKPQDGLDRAFQRTIERDVDIVVGSNKSVDVSQVTMAGTDGKPVRFYHVNGSAAAGGDGSAEAPFNSMQTAANAAGTDAHNGLSSYPVLYVTGDCGGATASKVDFSSGTASHLTHVTLTSPAVSYTNGGVTIPASTNTQPTLSSALFGSSTIVVPDTGHNLSSINIAGLQVGNSGNSPPATLQGAASVTSATINDCTFSFTGLNGAAGLQVGTNAYASITNTTISSSGNDGLFVRPDGTLAAGIMTQCTGCTISTTHTGSNAVGAWVGANVRLTNCTLSATSNTDGYGLRLYNSQVTMSGGSISNAEFGVYADVGSTATEGSHVTMTNVGTNKSSNGGSTINGF